MILCILRPSCFCENWMLCLPWITYDHLYNMHVTVIQWLLLNKYFHKWTSLSSRMIKPAQKSWSRDVMKSTKAEFFSRHYRNQRMKKLYNSELLKEYHAFLEISYQIITVNISTVQIFEVLILTDISIKLGCNAFSSQHVDHFIFQFVWNLSL